MSKTVFRVHPAINFARVGNSEDYYIAPETAAGELLDEKTGLFGGLPIKVGTENTPIDSTDFRDAEHKVKRQAARFRIFAYDGDYTTYPSTDQGREVKIGDKVGAKTVKDILWTVHLANKKNNFFKITSANGEEEGIQAYEKDPVTGQIIYPPIRNAEIFNPIHNPDAPGNPDMLHSLERLSKLVIDAGPRVLSSSASNSTVVNFDAITPCEFVNPMGEVMQAADYPVSFPSDHFSMTTKNDPITTLGQMRIETGTGRLIVTGGYGLANGIATSAGNAPSMTNPIDNDSWFDDTCDGPVNANIVYDDNSFDTVVGGWVVSTDPGYAPQTRNVVSVWDDMFNTWVEELALIPDLFSSGQYETSYEPSFTSDILPVFHAAFLQRWNTNLPSAGVDGHNFVKSIQSSDDPKAKIPDFEGLIRNPNNTEDHDTGVKMPLSLGDATKSFLSLSKTQYFLLKQWYNGQSINAKAILGAGEKLDKVVLENCLGGRYSPGIDLTFIVRDVNLYNQNWKSAAGPFRLNEEPLDYSRAKKEIPFLGVGYIPLQTALVEPGDLCKFMSQPWHSDYNSCAVHEPDPNPRQNNTLYWSWPAQRPVQVYPVGACTYNTLNNTWNLGGQVFSVRGDGLGDENETHSDYPQDEGRYQLYPDFVANWHKIGFIIQGCQISANQGGNYGADKFLEVSSRFVPSVNDEGVFSGDVVQTWPTSVISKPVDR